MTETPRVRAVDVRKQFGELQVLKGVSFEVRAGTVLSLLGASGSGKSTLLRCINHLEKPTGGEIYIDGQPIGRKGEGASAPLRPLREINLIRRDIGVVFQQFNLWPHMTVLGNVIEAPIRVRGVPRKEAIEFGRECLERVQLLEKADEYPARLSGGQQQRVAIARALAMKPKLIMFDEPTSSLDPNLTDEVLGAMRELAAAGTTMIVVTHEMGFAREVSDNVMFLHNGQVAEQGRPEEMFSNPKSEQFRKFLSRGS